MVNHAYRQTSNVNFVIYIEGTNKEISATDEMQNRERLSIQALVQAPHLKRPSSMKFVGQTEVLLK